MKNTFLIVFCWLLIIGCTQKDKRELSGLNSRDIDSLMEVASGTDLKSEKRRELNTEVYRLVSERENDSLTREYLFRLSESYFQLKDFEKCLSLSREIDRKSEEANDFLGLTRAGYSIANYHYLKYSTDSAYYYFSKAERASLKVKDQPYYGYILFSKANLLSLKKNFSRSEELAIKALKLALQKKNYLLAYDCQLLLGNALLGMNNYEQALEYYNKALKTTEFLKSEYLYATLQAQPYNYMGRVYQKMEKHAKAIEYFKKGLKIADFRKTNPSLFCYMANNLAYSELKLGDVNSDIEFRNTLAIADSINNIPAQITSKIYLSEYYIFMGDFNKAIFYAKEARRSANRNKIFEDELTCLQTLAKIDRKNAPKYTDRFIHLTDSLQNIERETRDKFARIEFETEELIKEKNYVISERDYLATQRWMIAIFGLLVISIFALLYFNSLQKSKNKELEFIQEQQRQNEEIYQLMLEQHQKLEEGKLLEKKRISQDLHDGVMGRLSGIRLNLYALTKKTDSDTIAKCLEQIPRIQEIEKEIRSISHDLSIDLFSGNVSFLQLIKKLLSDFEAHSKLQSFIEIDENLELETFTTHVKINIYRILQEALQNIAKYADAKNIGLIMVRSKDGISISIIDDGIGFDTQKAKGGIGLKNMKSRVADLRGRFEVSSEVDSGTKINFSIPI